MEANFWCQSRAGVAADPGAGRRPAGCPVPPCVNDRRPNEEAGIIRSLSDMKGSLSYECKYTGPGGLCKVLHSSSSVGYEGRMSFGPDCKRGVCPSGLGQRASTHPAPRVQ